MFIVNKNLVPKGYTAITLFPFIIFKNKRSITQGIISHEKIHLRQQAEMLILPFYIWYALEYLIKKNKYKTKFNTYKNLSFEREAYDNDANLDYLKQRKFYSWFKYINDERKKFNNTDNRPFKSR